MWVGVSDIVQCDIGEEGAVWVGVSDIVQCDIGEEGAVWVGVSDIVQCDIGGRVLCGWACPTLYSVVM